MRWVPRPMFSDIEIATLRAVLIPGDEGCEAFGKWWESVDLDSAGGGIQRLAPFLHRRAQEYDFRGSLRERLRGLSRHVWASNEFRVRKLAVVLAALQPSGGALLLKGAATLARFGTMSELRPLGDLDLLVRRASLRQAFEAMRGLGLHPDGVAIDDLTELDLDNLHAAPFQGLAFEAFDLHWRPLRNIVDQRLPEEMFAMAERTELAGQAVLVPALADHVFQLLAHGLDAKKDGRIDFLVEAAWVAPQIRDPQGWLRFHELATRYLFGSEFDVLLNFLRSELCIAIPAEAFRYGPAGAAVPAELGGPRGCRAARVRALAAIGGAPRRDDRYRPGAAAANRATASRLGHAAHRTAGARSRCSGGPMGGSGGRHRPAIGGPCQSSRRVFLP